MSVINQVLRDLDKRQQHAQGARVRSHYQPAGGRPWLWLVTLSAAIVISAVVTWWLVAHALTPHEQLAGNAPVEGHQTVNSQTESGQASMELIQPVTEDQADELSEERPEPQPTANVTAIAEASTAQASPSSAQREPPPVESTRVEPMLAPVNEHNVKVAAVSEPASAQQRASRQPHEGRQQDEEAEEAQTEESRGEMSVQRVERSASELAAQRLEQAVGALESGEGRKAESLLQEALVLAPQFVEARQQLAAYYYGRGFSSEALRVLREGLAHTPANSRLLTLSARIYEESGRADEALDMLNRIDADLPRQNDIVVLRAALANELGRYQIAADDYRQLLGVNPDQGIWWLGLGVAEEGRGHYDAARQAYQRAGQDRGLDRASREYASSRAEELASW